MARINLLPWRDQERRRRQRNFFMATGAAVALVLLVGLGVRMQFESMIAAQLTQQIAQLDQRIRKIQLLEETKADLLARMNVIQQLQESRPEVVHLFDELVQAIPDYFLPASRSRAAALRWKGAPSPMRACRPSCATSMRRRGSTRRCCWSSRTRTRPAPVSAIFGSASSSETGTGFSHFRLSFQQRRADPDATPADGQVGVEAERRSVSG